MEKHFELKISDKEFTFKRREKAIQDEAALDGIYVIRTSVPKEQMTSEEAVTGYKSLSSVERAFRSMKSVDLKVRPIHHFDDDRIRSHVFLCMLAYYTEWHMRQQLKELLFDDEEIVAAQEQRASVCCGGTSFRVRPTERCVKGDVDWPPRAELSGPAQIIINTMSKHSSLQRH
jgi:transposase